MTSDIALSGVACTSGVTPRQLVQSSSENDTCQNAKTTLWHVLIGHSIVVLMADL